MSDFSAQAAAAWDPDLRKHAFVVARQTQKSHKSAVISMSPGARSLGIFPGFPVSEVRRQYGEVMIVQEDQELLRTAASELEAVCSGYSPDYRVSAAKSIATVNLSGMDRLYSRGFERLERSIQGDIRDRLNLYDVATGAGSSTFIARLCARAAGENGAKRCEPGREYEVLAALKTTLLPGLGRKARQKLENYNLTRIGQVQGLSFDFLKSRLGAEGERLYYMVRGLNLEQKRHALFKRVRVDRTFPVDENDMKNMSRAVRYLSDRLCFELRQCSGKTGRLTMIIQYSDSKSAQQSARFHEPTWRFLDILRRAQELFAGLYKRRVSIRCLSLDTGKLYCDNGQLSLFDTAAEHRDRAVASQIDRIRERMGFDAIMNGDAISLPG
jgi:DNA polymerase-4